MKHMNEEIQNLKRALAIMHFMKWAPEIVGEEERKWMNEYLSQVPLNPPAQETK